MTEPEIPCVTVLVPEDRIEQTEQDRRDGVAWIIRDRQSSVCLGPFRIVPVRNPEASHPGSSTASSR